MQPRQRLSVVFFVGSLSAWAFYHMYLGRRLYLHWVKQIRWTELTFGSEASSLGAMKGQRGGLVGFFKYLAFSGSSQMVHRDKQRLVVSHAYSEDRMRFVGSALGVDADACSTPSI